MRPLMMFLRTWRHGKKVACAGSDGVRKFEAVVNAAKIAANDNGDIV